MKYNKIREKAFRTFKVHTMILCAILFVAAICIIFYCEAKLPLYSARNSKTISGVCNGVWVGSTHTLKSGRRIYGIIELDNNGIYYIPSGAVADYKYNEKGLASQLENRLVTVTLIKNYRNDYTVFGIETGGKEVISISDTNAHFKAVRSAVWAIYLVAAFGLFVGLCHKSPDAMPVLKEKIQEIKNRIKDRAVK